MVKKKRDAPSSSVSNSAVVVEEGGFVIDREQPRRSPSPEEAAAAAWVDEDEEFGVPLTSRLKKLRKSSREKRVNAAELENRLRERFSASSSNNWATKREDATELRRLAGASEPLAGSSRLSVERLGDANGRDPSRAVVRALDFDDDGLMLAGGLDKTLRLFKVDGESNVRVGAVHAEDCPIYSSKFVGNRKAVVSGRRPFFYKIDLETTTASKFPTPINHRDVSSLERFGAWADRLAFTANDGRVLLCDSKTGVWTGTVRLNGNARAAAFVDDKTLVCADQRAEIYRWDLRSTKRCLSRSQDPGNSPISALAVDGNEFMAVGSEAGVLNVYREGGDFPTFDKALLNLTTTVTSIAVNPHFLVYASSWAKDALRVVARDGAHTVYPNWPTSNTPLHYVHSLAFSAPKKNHTLLAMGNDRGRVLLYKLSHPNAGLVS